MYQRHGLATEPENTRQRLWRYMEYDKLLDLLKTSELYFRSVIMLDDKWEGMLTARTKESLYKYNLSRFKNPSDAIDATNAMEAYQGDFYVNCWHMNDHESYLMWRSYGTKGCAIQTNFERIIESISENPLEINASVIKYLDYRKDEINFGNAFFPIIHKDVPYLDEREFRLVCRRPNLVKHDIAHGEGTRIPINLEALIENIYLRPDAEMNREKIESYLSARKLTCTIKQSRIREWPPISQKIKDHK
jgi:hypothetical protein